MRLNHSVLNAGHHNLGDLILADVPTMVSLPRVTFQQVEKELRKRSFGILGTVSRDGRAHSTGVVYGVSPQDAPFATYVMTDTATRKVRNIGYNPYVSFCVPLFRRLLSPVPPSCIQFQGTAEILNADDRTAVRAFSGSYILHMMLNVASNPKTRMVGRICFIRIKPEKTLFTYGVGFSVWELRQHMENAAAKVVVPPQRLSGHRS